jgi:hypothetical protein
LIPIKERPEIRPGTCSNSQAQEKFTLYIHIASLLRAKGCYVYRPGRPLDEGRLCLEKAIYFARLSRCAGALSRQNRADWERQMAADNAVTIFTNMLEHLKQVSDGLKLLERAGWPHAANGEAADSKAQMAAAKAAALNVAAIAVEVARDAMQLCSRVDEGKSPAPSGPRKRPPKKRMI